YGEAFDQSWKSNEGDFKRMGRFGSHWGLWQDVNAPKEVVDTLYLGVRRGYNGAPQALQGKSYAAGDAYFASLLAAKDRKESADSRPADQRATNQMQDNYNAVSSDAAECPSTSGRRGSPPAAAKETR